jgi:C-terminal processing protease CtpA/Prc
MEQVYVHLPLKRAMHAVNPVQELRLLAQRAAKMAEREFHSTLLSIFLGLRDLHTNYILPAPMNQNTAYLPFRVEEFHDKHGRHYVVTEIFRGVALDPSFTRGVIITHWNGVQIDRAVDVNAEREAGSNPAARHARGLEALTMRWLGTSLPPDEDWVDVTYHAQGQPKDLHQARFEWMLYQSSTGELEVAQARGGKATAMGLDLRSEMERKVSRRIFRRSSVAPEITAKGGPSLATDSPAVFPRCGDVTTSAGVYGYIRIATFDVPDDVAFVQEFIRLVSQLSPNGLIIDVRGNGGGLVLAGERLLQCLTPRRIEPEKFHFINSKLTQRLCEEPDLKMWQESITQATQIGTEFSAGFPLLSEAECNDIGQIYQGPVVLITDALCYSTTDIFAAGFQDHDIGTIIGVSENTGAGGANVWSYDLLRQFVNGPDSPFRPLPHGAQFRVAIRRTTRVGKRSAEPLEDLGVQPDVRHLMTLRDVLEGNVDLIEFAAGILADKPKQMLQASVSPAKNGKRGLALHTRNVDRVDILFNDRPWKSLDMRLGEIRRSISFPTAVAARNSTSNVAEVRGFREGGLVVATRVRF